MKTNLAFACLSSFLWTSINALFGVTWPFLFLLLVTYIVKLDLYNLIEKEIRKRVLVRLFALDSYLQKQAVGAGNLCSGCGQCPAE